MRARALLFLFPLIALSSLATGERPTEHPQPELHISGYSLDDHLGGDGDGLLEAGERALLRVDARNLGDARAVDVGVEARASSRSLRVLSTAPLGDLDVGDATTWAAVELGVTDRCVADREVVLITTLEAPSGRRWTEELRVPLSCAVASAGPLPNLLASDPIVTPGVAEPGESIDIAFDLENDGGALSGAFEVHVVLSTNDIFTTSFDDELCVIASAGLDVGEITSVLETCTVPSLDVDDYYLGLIIDDAELVPESDEDDNDDAFFYPFSIVPPDVDLIADAVEVAQATATSGDPLDFTLTVTNAGTQKSGESTADLYLSTNTTISTSDDYVCSLDLPSLDPGLTEVLSASCPAPYIDSDTYYAGALVDAEDLQLETDESNNDVYDPITLELTGLPVDWSLASTPLLSTYVATPGNPFDLSFEVRNEESSDSPEAEISILFSFNTTITDSDVEACRLGLPALAPLETRSLTASCSVPALDDDYYYVAAYIDLDDLFDEGSDSDNEDYDPDPMLVTASGSFVELLPDPPVPSVDLGRAGDPLTVDISVSNSGTVATGPFDAAVFFSTNTTITSGSDTEICRTTMDIPPGSVGSDSLSCTVPALADGAYYLGLIADVDGVLSEIDSTNNDVARETSFLITPKGGWVDLDASAGPVLDRYQGSAGESFTIDYTLHNRGTDPSGAFDVAVMFSSNTTISGSDTEACRISTPSLDPGDERAESFACTVPSLSGDSYYVGLLIDEADAVPELDESNNTPYDETVFAIERADLEVVATSLSTYSAGEGDSVTISATVRNNGLIANGPTDVTALLSTHDTLGSSDDELCRLAVPAIAPGGSYDAIASCTVPSLIPSLYYTGSYVDLDDDIDESDESNNDLLDVTQFELAATGPPPVLELGTITVIDTDGDGILRVGEENVELDIELLNTGGGSAFAVEGMLTTSSPDIILVDDAADWGDIPAGGAVVADSDDLNVEVDPGCGADFTANFEVEVEDSTGNSWTLPFSLPATCPATPDIAIDDVSLSTYGTYRHGESFDVDVTFRNDADVGTGAFDSTVLFSTNTTITVDFDTTACVVTVADVPALSTVVETLSCPVPSVTGTHYVGVVSDSDELIFELDETNNEGYDATSIDVQPAAPELVIDSWEITDAGGDGDGIPESGEPLALSLDVRNEGTADAPSASGSLSTDDPQTTITSTSTAFGPISVGAVETAASPFTLEVDGDCAADFELELQVDLTDPTGSSSSSTIRTDIICERDDDGDGYTNLEECDDDDAAINPDADERCNGVDDDCDGDIDEAGAVDAPSWYLDADADGYGDPEEAVQACEQPASHVEDSSDCDDSNPSVFPGANEVCNEIDDDCSGTPDDDPVDGSTVWVDEDGDGYGDPSNSLSVCEPTDGLVENDEDCDDSSADISPEAVEVCNGVDDDCDDAVDAVATDAPIWYIDADGDGYGDSASSVAECEQPSGYADNAEDCDDGDSSAFPGAEGWSEDCTPVGSEPGDSGEEGKKGCSTGGYRLIGWSWLLALAARRRSVRGAAG